MKKKSSFSTKGQRADIGDLVIYRLLANRYADAVGPFVFLDHLTPSVRQKIHLEGTGAHPHRGIATLTYLLNGEAEHFDSAGNYARVHSGGAQWMKAGKGIIHDETLNPDSRTDSKLVHGFQFWINLPSKIKEEKPAYISIEGDKVPVKDLPGDAGRIRVIAGSYESLISVIPSYSEQFLYHVELKPGKTFSLTFPEKIEVAVFLPVEKAVINEETYDGGTFIEYDRSEGEIEIVNPGTSQIDIIVFGGAPYTEPIVAEGPFVMGSKLEIANAYRDYYNGDYGKIDYDKQRGRSTGA